jgi:tRNA A-37 threonylcarbamoyl transferase component Bud32
MSFIDPSDEKQRKIHERVRALILQSSEKITQNIQMETGRISDTRLKKIQYFQGAGGKTYVIEAALSTSLAGEIDGGIVLKFAKDLDAEVDNANRLAQLLKVRQKDWENWKKNKKVPERIRKYPDLVFAPEVIHVIPEVKTMILEFLGGFTPLLQVQFEKEAQWGFAGYALARLHGSKRQQTNIQLYNPLLRMLKAYIDDKYLDYWVDILEQSMGGVEFIHGDSHMSNIMVSPTRIAWIDAMMLPDLDRMDDIGYFISHAVQEHVTGTVGFSFNEDRLINNITRSWVPLILATYKRTYDISQLYSQLPLDFFLGSHLIIRAGLWEEEVSSILIRLGQRFIYERPISRMLED